MSGVRYRIGVIGLGKMGWNYLETLRKHERWEAVSVCDLDEEVLERVRTSHPGVDVAKDAGELIGDSRVQVVGVFTLADARPGLIEKALESGKHVMAEKPIADTVAREKEVLEKIDEWAGITIAAHIERWPSGFLESGESRQAKMRIHASPYLSALEITIPQYRELWNNGEVRDYPKKYACIQGSDAHDLDEIGRRPVYIKMDNVNLSSLSAAFNDYREKIAFPDEYEESYQQAA